VFGREFELFGKVSIGKKFELFGKGSFGYYVMLRDWRGIKVLLRFMLKFFDLLTKFITGREEVSEMAIFSVK